MNTEIFFKHPSLSYLECRRSRNSGRHYKLHLHRTLSIGAVDQGEVEYRINDETGILRSGEIILINPETLHSCNPVEKTIRNYYMLYLDTDWCLALQQSLWKLEQFHPVSLHKLVNPDLYSDYIMGMEILLNDNDLLIKEQTAIELVERIFIHSRIEAVPQNESTISIDRIKNLLASDLSEDLSLQQISKACLSNPYTLIRQFKTATGVTPHAYRLNCRIEYSKLLLQKKMDLSEIALECGFYDQSHFSRSFKAVTAVTPREYMINIQH